MEVTTFFCWGLPGFSDNFDISEYDKLIEIYCNNEDKFYFEYIHVIVQEWK